MQRVLSGLRSGFSQLFLTLCLICLIVSGLFVVIEPSIAAPISTEGQKLIQQEQRDKASQQAEQASQPAYQQEEQREQAYEQQIEAEKDIDKVYEENVKIYKGAPEENLVEKTVEGAQKLVEKVTGKD